LKILYFTKYTIKAASSRLRSFQYFPLLSEQEINVKVTPLFSSTYLDKLYCGKTPIFEIIKGYSNRFFRLFTVFSYDKVVIEKELFPYFPSWFERIFFLLKVSYVVDYDDAIFHNYDLHPNSIIRFFLKNKIDLVMKCSSDVISGNTYLAERARNAGARSIHIIPTVIDISRYANTQRITKKANSKLIIGWVGSPSTFKYVQQLGPVLKELVEKFDAEIHIVGAAADLGFNTNIKYIPWSEKSEVEIISSFDIGIMPLEDSPWEKGKCAYKLIQYMGCKVPVIASPVGMNTEVIEEGVNGYFAKTKQEWRAAFISYIMNPALREEHGQAGFEFVSKNYSLEIVSRKVVAILKK